MTLTMTTAPVAWFEALAALADGPAAERFRRLGVTDTTFAVRVGDEAVRLVFDGFGCSEVAPWDGTAPVDFVLEGPAEAWQALQEGATLNSLVLGGSLRLSGDDQLGIDCFYRYNPTLQAFVELAAELP